MKLTITEGREPAVETVRSIELIEGERPAKPTQADYDIVKLILEETQIDLGESKARIEQLEARLKCQTTALKQVNTEIEAQLAEANARADAAEKRAQADWQKVQAIEAELTLQIRGKQAELDKSRELREQAEARAADLARQLAESKRLWEVADQDRAASRNSAKLLRLNLSVSEERQAAMRTALEEIKTWLESEGGPLHQRWVGSEISCIAMYQNVLAALNPDTRQEGEE